MKLTRVIQIYKSMFPIKNAIFVYRIKEKISDILWTMFGNSWKCIFNCVSWFLSLILNFSALCGAYTVLRHYTLLLKSNRIFCFLLEVCMGPANERRFHSTGRNAKRQMSFQTGK